MKKISKMLVFFTDGTFEEVIGTGVTAFPNTRKEIPIKYPNQCLVCADPEGHGNLPCPNMRAYSLGNTNE